MSNATIVLVTLVSYKILLILLRYKGQHVPPLDLYQCAWYDGAAQPVAMHMQDQAVGLLKTSVSRLRSRMREHVPAFQIPSMSGTTGYTCTGAFTFCAVLNEALAQQLQVASCEPS